MSTNIATTNIFEEATNRVRLFAEANGFKANEKILKCPMVNSEVFFIGRDTNGFNYCPKELKNDMGISEAVTILDDLTDKPVIIYDGKKFSKMDELDKIQTLIHELLHYKECENYQYYPVIDDVDGEAEDELLSIIITHGYDKDFESAHKHVKSILPDIADSYDRKEIGQAMISKADTIKLKDIYLRII